MTGGEVFDLAPFGAPFGEAAVEDGDIGLAHEAEGPPDAGGGEETGAVIDHDLMAVAHAHGAQAGHEFLDRRGHVRQGAALIGNVFDVEEARAGNMGGAVFRAGVAACVGKIPRGIEDAQVGVAQMGGEPVGGNEGLGIVGHGWASGHAVRGQLAGSGLCGKGGAISEAEIAAFSACRKRSKFFEEFCNFLRRKLGQSRLDILRRRAFSRSQSRFALVSRLSASFLPLAIPSFTFTMPRSLK